MKKFLNNNKGLLIGVSVVLLLVIFTLLQNTNTTSGKDFDESLLGTEVSEWLNKTREDDFVVTVLGMTTCPHCQNYKPVIEGVTNDEDLNLYFFEIDTVTNEDDFNALENAYNLENYEGAVPYTFITKNGEFVCDTVGAMDVENTKSFLKSCGVLN